MVEAGAEGAGARSHQAEGDAVGIVGAPIAHLSRRRGAPARCRAASGVHSRRRWRDRRPRRCRRRPRDRSSSRSLAPGEYVGAAIGVIIRVSTTRAHQRSWASRKARRPWPSGELEASPCSRACRAFRRSVKDPPSRPRRLVLQPQQAGVHLARAGFGVVQWSSPSIVARIFTETAARPCLILSNASSASRARSPSTFIAFILPSSRADAPRRW